MKRCGILRPWSKRITSKQLQKPKHVGFGRFVQIKVRGSGGYVESTRFVEIKTFRQLFFFCGMMYLRFLKGSQGHDEEYFQG